MRLRLTPVSLEQARWMRRRIPPARAHCPNGRLRACPSRPTNPAPTTCVTAVPTSVGIVDVEPTTKRTNTSRIGSVASTNVPALAPTMRQRSRSRTELRSRNAPRRIQRPVALAARAAERAAYVLAFGCGRPAMPVLLHPTGTASPNVRAAQRRHRTTASAVGVSPSHVCSRLIRRATLSPLTPWSAIVSYVRVKIWATPEATGIVMPPTAAMLACEDSQSCAQAMVSGMRVPWCSSIKIEREALPHVTQLRLRTLGKSSHCAA
jgi:hypothetical protein